MSETVWRFARSACVALWAFASPAMANTINGAPLIPEPLVFDMIRPLASPRGKIEANTLVLAPLAASEEQVDGAAEVKFSFADGWGAEFDVPFEDERHLGYTVALQGTFGTFANKRAVHGFQAIAIRQNQTGQIDASLLYIVGMRYSRRWSSLSMIGINRSPTGLVPGVPRDYKLLLNNTVFNDVGPNTIVGIETNIRAGDRSTEWLVMPQVHQRLSKRIMMLVGVGVQKPALRPAHPTLAIRLTREF